MARTNLIKSEVFLTNTTVADPDQLKSPLSEPIYLVKVPLNVNIVKQHLLHKKQPLKNLWSEGGFQLMLILSLLAIYFDALYQRDITFIQIGSGHTVVMFVKTIEKTWNFF